MRLEAFDDEPAGGLRASFERPYVSLRVRHLGVTDYLGTWRAMQNFTTRRDADTEDELWLLEHLPIYTVGLNGKPENLPRDSMIPVLKTDRGGQITFHGPGQIVAYLLLDLHRLGIGTRELVRRMEQSVIDLLQEYNIEGEARIDAPGVYVNGAKIAALGLRVRQGCCYHGLALNVNMDLRPFLAINPCGYSGLKVTQLRDMGVDDSLEQISRKISEKLLYRLHRI